MIKPIRRRWALLAAAVSFGVGAAPAPQKVIAHIDLSKPFHLKPGASMTATQGPSVEDAYGDPAPGTLRVCIRISATASCSPDLSNNFTYSRYLEIADIVRPRSSGLPLLHLQLGTLHSGDGSQGHTAVILTYRPSAHRFERILEQVVGGNMNQEIRYMAAGPLKGAVIRVEPTSNTPFGYWVTVNRLVPGYHYRQALHYRSATIYGDGNRFAVIDSEMPNILRRLGLWHPGEPLPLPKSPCPQPHLVKTELWCSTPPPASASS